MSIKSFGKTKTETDYKAATSRDKRKYTELKVNKLEGEIRSVVSQVEGYDEQISEITQTSAELQATMTNSIADLQTQISELNFTSEELLLAFKKTNGNNLIKNSVMRNGTAF